MKRLKRFLTVLLTLALALSIGTVTASAKTITSARGDNIFFYAENAAGKSVLLKVVPLGALKSLSHGAADGENYYISTTDNYPTTQYCEAQGFTIPELVDYIRSVTTVGGADEIGFSGDDTLRLMATDSYGNYSRSWTCEQLYGVKRYYFEGLYDAESGWKPGWEIAGEDNAKFGVGLDEYNEKYKDSDPYYADKRAVFAGGRETTVILATESLSGRTTSAALSASTELGIADYVAANGGTAAGCLKDALTDDCALRLSLPMTEADLMTAHRTAYDNFKWIYNMRLDMADAPDIRSLGTVAEPVPAFTKSADGGTLTITFACATPGASVYYSFDGAPQTLYTGAVTYDIGGRDLAADPVTVYATAVEEGYDDAGVLTFKYPGTAPAFQTVYTGMAGSDLTFTAASGVSTADWMAWTGALNFVTVKTPSVNGYVTVNRSEYIINNAAKTITFDKTLFTESGSYSFVFHATKYADKALSVTMKKAVPAVDAAESYAYGEPITLTFDDSAYQSALYVYATPEGGSRTMISSSFLDRTAAGQVTVKADYFALASAAIKGAGTYTLELNNNNYSPSTQTVVITITGGFDDVAGGSWYYDAVMYAMDNGLFDATDEGFSPEASMTRLMLAEALYRLSGSPKVTEESPFEDCSAASVAWACGAGIVNGMGDGTFAPGDSITREQIAAMFCRYAGYIGGDLTVSGDTGKFSDAAAISDWAKNAMTWAVGMKLINGMGDGTVAPQGTATRAQVAQILLNYSGPGGNDA